VFYASAAADPTGDLVTFFNSIKALFLNTLSWQVPNTGDLIDDATGTLTGTWVGASGASVAATGAPGSFAAGVGAFVNWSTGTIVNGRRLKGRTFLTNLSTGSYDAAGTIAAASLTTLGNAATTLVTAGKMVTWHRPAPGGAGGTSALWNGQSIPDQVTSLRSRRV